MDPVNGGTEFDCMKPWLTTEKTGKWGDQPESTSRWNRVHVDTASPLLQGPTSPERNVVQADIAASTRAS